MEPEDYCYETNQSAAQDFFQAPSWFAYPQQVREDLMQVRVPQPLTTKGHSPALLSPEDRKLLEKRKQQALMRL
jgi:hypothetical protein